MNWLSEYKKSLKNIHAEELLDIYIYRPFAFIIVKSLYRFPLTPNNYSFFSFFFGMMAAWTFYNGSLQVGALYFFLFAVLDCCDGMQARMKKNGTEFGRFIDGIVDYSSNAACYVALTFGLSKVVPSMWGIPVWALILLAGFSKAIHSMFYDHYLMEYLSYDRGEGGFTQKEIQNLREKIVKAQTDPTCPKLRILILKLYLGFTSIQSGNKEQTLKFPPKEYTKKNHLAIQLWGVIGPSWHITMLIIAFWFNHPEWLIVYAIVFGNIWMMLMLIYQRKILQDLKLTQARA